MLLLAIDTSTTAITVAVHDGSTVRSEATTLDARGHAEHLAPNIARVLRDIGADPRAVSDVAVGLGPGPFTGLRVGVVTARVFALSVGARLHGVVSLDALAAAAVSSGTVSSGDLLVATDARRREVYHARYTVALGEPGGIRAVGEPGVARAGDLSAEVVSLPCVGRGAQLYPQDLPHGISQGHNGFGLLDVSAAALASLVVARLDAGVSVEAHEPLYLRRPDAVPSVSAKSALG